jgi:hypothetical protein
MPRDDAATLLTVRPGGDDPRRAPNTIRSWTEAGRLNRVPDQSRAATGAYRRQATVEAAARRGSRPPTTTSRRHATRRRNAGGELAVFGRQSPRPSRLVTTTGSVARAVVEASAHGAGRQIARRTMSAEEVEPFELVVARRVSPDPPPITRAQDADARPWRSRLSTKARTDRPAHAPTTDLGR